MIKFWQVGKPYGEFSNWYICSVTYEGKQFCSSEQVFMYMKARLFCDEITANKILYTSNQREIKALGREVKNFDQAKWDANKYDFMLKANKLKLLQNPKIMNILRDTKDEIICEASPYDKVWGIGIGPDDPKVDDINNWQGENLLGKVLMDIRDADRINLYIHDGEEK